MRRVLVTGARGKTGRPLVEALRGRAHVRGGTRDPGLLGTGDRDLVAFDWDARATWAPALDGVDAVYVVRPDREDAPELVGALAAKASPARIVLLSEQEPVGWAADVEAAVPGATLLQPSWFMQVFTDPRFYADAIAAGRLPMTATRGSIAWIDARDIADAAAAAVLDDRHAGRAYTLTGPRAIDLPETAALLRVQLVHSGQSGGQEDWAASIDRELWERVESGAFAGVSDDVEAVCAHAPRTLEAFVEEALRPQDA